MTNFGDVTGPRWVGGANDALSEQETRFARIKKVLVEWGMAKGGDPHSWRCGHPDLYGACTCVDEIAADISAALDV